MGYYIVICTITLCLRGITYLYRFTIIYIYIYDLNTTSHYEGMIYIYLNATIKMTKSYLVFNCYSHWSLPNMRNGDGMANIMS